MNQSLMMRYDTKSCHQFRGICGGTGMRYFKEWAIFLLIMGCVMSGVAWWDDSSEGRAKPLVYYLAFPWAMLIMLPIAPLFHVLKWGKFPDESDGPFGLFMSNGGRPPRDDGRVPGYGRKRQGKKKKRTPET